MHFSMPTSDNHAPNDQIVVGLPPIRKQLRIQSVDKRDASTSTHTGLPSLNGGCSKLKSYRPVR